MNDTTINVALADMKISAVNGSAFIDFGAYPADLRTHLLEKITVTDSAGKAIIGYIKAVGTGETYGGEQLGAWTNVGFNSFTAIGINITNASESGVNGYAYNVSGLTEGALYKVSVDVALSSGAMPSIGWGGVTNGEIGLDWPLETTVLPATDYYKTWANKSPGYDRLVYSGNVTQFSATNSQKQVLTPATTGVTIVSASGGNTFNWTSKDAAFNYADAAGYTVTITNSAIEVLVYRAMILDAAVTRLINTRVYPVVMPQDVTLPAVSYQRVSTDPVNHLGGYSGLKNAHIVINAWGRNYDEAKAIASAIHAAMDAARAFRCVLTNELDGYDQDVQLYVISHDYSCWGAE